MMMCISKDYILFTVAFLKIDKTNTTISSIQRCWRIFGNFKTIHKDTLNLNFELL